MADLTGHTRRDADDAARKEIAVVLGKFSRRLNESTKAQNRIDTEGDKHGSVDEWDRGTQIGRENARAAIAQYLTAEGKEALGLPTGN